MSSVYICTNYFQDFLNHLLKQAKKDNEVTDEKLIEYTDTMVPLQYLLIINLNI